MVDSWKNQYIKVYVLEKKLVIGATDNLIARNIFECTLSSGSKAHGLDITLGKAIFETNFTASKKAEEEL
jgi:hypothetical protein